MKMKIILILISLGWSVYADIPLSNDQKEVINKAMEKLKNDKDIMKEFYFIGRMNCYSFAELGNPKYIKRSLGMQKHTYFRIASYLLKSPNVQSYFKKQFTKKILYNKRVQLSKNQELYHNKERSLKWTAYYVCEKLNIITEENTLKYKKFIEDNKKNLSYNFYLYKESLTYLKDSYYYRPVKPMSIENQTLVSEANKIFEDTATVLSVLTDKEYIAEASALRGSIWLSNSNIDIEEEYRDDLGRVGTMKNKPIIATAKKFKEFMDNSFTDGEIIHVSNPKSYKEICEKMCGKKGLYIMLTEENIGYKLTGFVSQWNGTQVREGNDYVKYAKDVWLYVFND